MIIYDTIQLHVVIVKNLISQFSHSFIYDHLEEKHNRGMLPLLSFTYTLAIRFIRQKQIFSVFKCMV